jgi:hypothetical protein
LLSSSQRGHSRGPVDCASSLIGSFGDSLQLVVPEQLRATVIEAHF